MTATIDKRVVEMAFENDKFEKGVGTSLSTIDRLKKSLNFDGADKGFNGITTSANNVNLSHISSSLEDVKNRFSLMGIVGMTIIQNLTNSTIALGKKLVEAFIGIDSIKAGFGSYETKIEAIRTVMSGTGETIDEVTQSINDLNKYSDRTIFSFQDMTSNISKFTNAGLSSKQAATAIQGISNVAAESGANAGEAARAMYNFGQALSQGSIRLMDWKSIENANMATIEFKTQLLEAAAAAGTLTKEADGTFKTLEKGTNITATKHFNDTLEEQWLTADVLIKTLGDYASLETEIGKKANAAATQVKTFSQLMATFADSLKTGWTKSFELVIGDLDQATSFFSTMNNFLGDTAVAAARSRNALLQGWNDLGGRTKLIEAFQNALNGIVAVANPIISAFKEFFPPVTAQQLFNLTEGLAKFTEKIKMAAEGTDKIKRIFSGVFAIFDIVKMAVIALAKQFGILAGSFSDTGAGFTEFLAKFGDWLVGLRDAIKQSDVFTTIFTNISNVIGPLLHGVIGFFSALTTGFKNTNKATKSNSMVNFLAELSEKFKSFGKLGLIVSKVFDILSRVAEKFGPVFKAVAGKLGDLVNHLLDAVTRGLDKLDANKILDFFNKGLLGGVLLSLNSFINQSKSIVGGGLFASILLSIKDFISNGGSVFKGAAGVLDGVKNSLDAYQKTLKSNTLLKIAAAVGILALSIIALTLVDQGKLVNATAVIGAMFVGLTSTLDVFEKTTDGGKKLIVMTASLIGISASLLILSGAILILSKLDPKEALQGVLAVGAILALLLMFQKFSSGSKGLAGATLGLLGLSVALLGLNLAIRSLGGMDTEVLTQGLLGMAAALTIVGVAMNTMNASVGGAASLLIASAAILVLAVSLKMVGELSLEQIGIGLLAIAGVLTVLGVAGALLTPVAPTIAIVALSLLAIGAAAAAFGLAIGSVGLGLGTLALGIVALAGLTSVGIGALTLVITGIAALIPMLAIQVVKGITAFLLEIYKSAPKIALALVGIGVELLKGFAKITPQVVVTILDLIMKLQDALMEKLPVIVQNGYTVLLGFLSGIRDNIGEVVTVSIDIVNAYLTAVAGKIPEIVDSGWNLIISWIDGMRDGVTEHLPVLMDSVRELGLAIVKGVLTGLIEGHADAKAGIIELGRILIEGFKENLGIHSPSSVFTQLASYIVQGLTNGIIQFGYKAISEIVKLGTKIVNALKGKYDSMVSAGKDLVTGFADGIKNYIGTAIDNAKKLATSVLDAIKSTLGIHSPSTETFEAGKFATLGFAGGISAFSDSVVSATRDLSKKTISGFSSIISSVTDAINSDMNFAPSIRPVVDLTGIQNSSSLIDSILGNKTINLGVAATNAASIAPTSQTETTPTDVGKTSGDNKTISFTQINNSPKELSRIDIYRQTKNQLLQIKGMVGA